MSGVSGWHRQQRKKELQKNREIRVKSRDEIAVKTKTSGQIRDELRDLERQAKRGSHQKQQQFHLQSKIDRLKKELKLVKEHEEKEAAAAAAASASNGPGGGNNRQDKQQPKNALPPILVDHPEVSVYYDPTLNPYGAPPPGRPMLFRRRGGGVTPNWREADLPPEALRPPPPPPPPPSSTSQRPNQQQQRPQSTSTSNPPRRDNQQQEQRQSQPPPRRSAPQQPPPPPPPPSEPEPRPEPRRRKYREQLDVWADPEEEEEVALAEEEAAERDVEQGERGDASRFQWYYRDTSNAVQGPFGADHMVAWIRAGFFPPETPVLPRKEGKSGPSATEGGWTNLGRCGALQKLAAAPSNGAAPTTNDDNGVQSRIAALRGGNDSADTIQQRIEALKRQQQPEGSSNSDDGVQDRIAALRGNTAAAKDRGEDGDSDDDAVQQRIQALRQLRQKDEGMRSNFDPSGSDDDDETGQSSVQDRIRALREADIALPPPMPSSEMEPNEAEVALPPPPDHVQLDDNIPPAYPIDDDGTSLPPPPPPPLPSRSASERENEIPPAYPVDDEDAGAIPPPPAPKPQHEESGVPPSYPVADADISYPVDDDKEHDLQHAAYSAYPVEDDGEHEQEAGADSAYPVTDEYPVVDAYPTASDEEASRIEQHQAEEEQPKKKRLKVDKSVISLLPAHLQKKRSEPSSKKESKDDLDKLLEEVDGI